ncbi:MAG: hypothetical protein FJ387_25255 [Verrucomicrobia bacterium]|nr:hypothetical protein [Verrucomicrobiota bacterium]
MNGSLILRWLSVGFVAFALATAPIHADEEQDFIATLQSAATAPQKCSACQKLRVLGTAQAVPALAAMLGEEQVAHAARYALEAIPGPEAATALREALSRSSGLRKAGLVDSLGWRRERDSVPFLTPLLEEADPAIASTAASALGRIGGRAAVTALIAALDQAPAAVRTAAGEGLLECAERLLANGNSTRAAALYRRLADTQSPTPIRIAAWRGLMRSEPSQRPEQLVTALTSQDRDLRSSALGLVRELGDAAAIQTCLQQWATLPADAQLAVLEAHLRLGAEARPTIRAAIASPHLSVRVAAWNALADAADPTAVPALAKTAAQGQPLERTAARDALTRVRGPGVREALLAHLRQADSSEQAEVLRALGERGDTNARDLLLEYAGAAAEPVRLAALEALHALALPDTLEPLLEVAVRAPSDATRQTALRTLQAVCQATPDPAASSRTVTAALGRFPTPARRHLLPLLVLLGTADALAAAQTATRDPDTELAKEAVRTLAQWPNAAPAAHVLELARPSADPTLPTLALRAGIALAGLEPDLTRRLEFLKQALTLAQRPEEKRQALGQLGQMATADALALALAALSDPALANEAAAAALAIAEKLAVANPKLAHDTAVQVLARNPSSDLARRAWALRAKPKPGPFIQDWLVAGPYRQPGVVGAEAVFNLEFGPEKTGQAVTWHGVPRGDHVNLAALFPGQEHCVAYLRAQLVAPEASDAVLLIGSDDGVKAWLNGAVVHSNNVDRGEVPDQDAAPIRLNRGANALLLKITQGDGGWSARARVVGTDGSPLAGLRAETQTAAAPPVRLPQPPPVAPPQAATLPPRDSFRTLRLADQFYAEGAYYGDFNRDGALDIVAGPFWFAGPSFQQRHEYRPVQVFDPKDYSDNFLTFAGDFNGDGWTDVLGVPFPGKEAFWYENPAGQTGHWPRHLAYPVVGNESPMWGDVTGDGQPELIFCNEGYLGYAGPNRAQPTQPWVFHAVSTQDKRFQRFTHGVGFGDVNGDRRIDLVEAVGWWEQPAEPKPGQPWTFHPFRFADAAAQMLVYDVNGDGHADIVTAWHCHLYGLIWWQQLPCPSGSPDWRQHTLLSPTPDVATADFRVSQLHALELVDLNGDGLKDILTGKRYWAHGPTGDKEPDAPPVVFWLELRRDSRGEASFVPHLIDDNSGVGTQVAAADLNGDRRPDVVVGNKKGVFVHLSQPAQ